MLLRNRLYRDEASMAGYRILHLIILCLGSVPDSLPSALAWEVLQLSTNNQSYGRQNAAGFEPHILQITTSESELFPLRCIKTTKFNLHNISCRSGQVIRIPYGSSRTPWQSAKPGILFCLSSSLHLLACFPSLGTFFRGSSHFDMVRLTLFIFQSLFHFFLSFIFFFLTELETISSVSIWESYDLWWACCGAVSLQYTAGTSITWGQ